MTPILSVRNLEKHFGEVRAVDGVSFDIHRGVCFGLLGPNGAGKTTTIEVIEDIIPPTSGEILYKGRPRSAGFKQEVGIQFQHTALFDFMLVKEVLFTFASLYRKTADIDELIEICRLADILERMNDRLSGGQKQRLLLAVALINDPELLFLDEPSTGLDPQARRNLWEIVKNIQSRGKTIVLTTHYMEEAEYLCDEIAIMDSGVFIAEGSPADLIRRHLGETTIFLPVESLPQAALTGENRRKNGDRIEIRTGNVKESLSELISMNADLSEMSVRSPNLEDVFLKLTGRQLRE